LHSTPAEGLRVARPGEHEVAIRRLVRLPAVRAPGVDLAPPALSFDPQVRDHQHSQATRFRLRDHARDCVAVLFVRRLEVEHDARALQAPDPSEWSDRDRVGAHPHELVEQFLRVPRAIAAAGLLRGLDRSDRDAAQRRRRRVHIPRVRDFRRGKRDENDDELQRATERALVQRSIHGCAQMVRTGFCTRLRTAVLRRLSDRPTLARMPVMKGAPAGPGLRLAGARELLLPLTLGVCFVLYYLMRVPGWVVVAVALPMAALYLFAPSWATRSVERFDRDLVRLLSTGGRGALPRRYALALGMRLFAPPAITAERRALVAAETGQSGEARASYRAALREYGKRAPLRVLLGYAHACYAVADDGEAIRAYRELLAQEGMLPGVRRNLAHALVRRGEALREALELIDDESALRGAAARGHELDLLRAVAHAKLGNRDRARELLAQSGEVQGELALSLRAELQRTLDGAAEARPA
jgi:hypothetical protein